LTDFSEGHLAVVKEKPRKGEADMRLLIAICALAAGHAHLQQPDRGAGGPAERRRHAPAASAQQRIWRQAPGHHLPRITELLQPPRHREVREIGLPERGEAIRQPLTGGARARMFLAVALIGELQPSEEAPTAADDHLARVGGPSVRLPIAELSRSIGSTAFSQA
jgi:hypothetical protein